MTADLILNVDPDQVQDTRSSLEEKRQSSEIIRSVVLTRSESPSLHLDTLLFDELSHFSLVSLDLQFAGARVSISALANALKPTLRYLYFENVTLSGQAEDLAAALTNHPSLRRLQLGCAQADRDNFSWNSIFRALQSLQQDLWLLLDFHPELRGQLDAQVLVDSISSPTVQLLYLGDLPRSILPQVTQSLQANKSLESLGMEIKDPSRSQVAASILNTNTSLTSLAVALEDDTSKLLGPILTSLKLHNRTVTDLKLSGPIPWNHTTLAGVSDMLSQNTVVQELHIHEESGNFLETNPDIGFYLQLNQAGRHLLEEKGGSRRDWVETIIDSKDNVSVVFYFLSKNPVLLFGSDAAGCLEESKSLAMTATHRPTKRRKIDTEGEKEIQTS